MDILAVASVAAGGAAFTYNKGCASVANSGVGLNDITLDNPADFAACTIFGASLNGAASSVTLTHISDTVKRVSTFLEIAGVMTPSNLVPFTFLLIR
jgi:hypothetical protein